MIHIEESILINRPIEEVFAYVCDFRTALQWQSGVVDVQVTPEGPMGVGTRVTAARLLLGRKIEGVAEVIEYAAPTKQIFKTISGPVDITNSRRFEPTAEGTKLSHVMDFQGGVLFALAEPLVARTIRRALVADFGTLKDLLESQASGASASPG